MSIMNQQIKTTDNRHHAPHSSSRSAMGRVLKPYQLAALALSMELHVPAPRFNDIAHEKRPIIVDTALWLAKFLGNSAELWMGLQTDFDMTLVHSLMPHALDRIGNNSLCRPNIAKAPEGAFSVIPNKLANDLEGI